jgi:hypothetical protein
MAKVVAQAQAAKDVDMYGWACFTLIMSSFLVAQRFFDQAYILARGSHARNNEKGGEWSGCCYSYPLTCILLFPFTIVFLPISAFSGMLYSARTRHLKAEVKKTALNEAIIGKRPLSTMMLGTPLYSMAAFAVVDQEIISHPLEAHFRNVQLFLQGVLEDLSCIIIDIIIFLRADEMSSAYLYGVSFAYSLFMLFISCCIVVTEVNAHEHAMTPIEGQDGQTLMGKPGNFA